MTRHTVRRAAPVEALRAVWGFEHVEAYVGHVGQVSVGIR